MNDKEIFVFGHRKPDTDATTAAISLAYLKRQLGYNAVPRVLGGINRETKFVLNYFKVKEPRYLNDVKLKIKDVNYVKDCKLCINDSIYGAFKYMNENKMGNIPVVDSLENNNLVGTISMKDIADNFFNGDTENLKASYDHILNTIHGTEVLRFDDYIEGRVMVASFKSTRFIEEVEIHPDSIVIVGDRHSLIEYVVNSKAKLLILTGNSQIKPEHLEIAKKNHVNVIVSSDNSFKIATMINSANDISVTGFNQNVITINENTSVSEFTNIAEKTKFSNFPVINRHNKYLGVVRLSDLADRTKRKVILVDHNEYEQTVDGIEDADIIEIVDHHKIGSIGTSSPINFRNMPVGSSNTIIRTLYRENNVAIPREIAGCMLSGIISDTLLFKSPTTTQLDIDTAKELSKIAGVDYEKYGFEMLKAGASIKGKTPEEVLYTDYKIFTIDNKKVAIGQISTFDFKEFEERKSEYVKAINNTAMTQDFTLVALFITDLVNEGSYVLYNDSAKKILEGSFDVENFEQGTFLPGCVSRKQQIVPKIMDFMD